MRKMLAGLAALALGLAAHHPAQAQGPNRNKVINSGNGAFNTIAIRNRAFASFPVPPLPAGHPAASHPFAHGPAQAYPVPGAGGFNFNHVRNSGNGVGNNITIRNSGFGYHYPAVSYGGVTVGGVNINVITNSGNGAGNSITISNH